MHPTDNRVSRRGRIARVVAHCAGLIDLIAAPAPSGGALAATPAMRMTSSAIRPILGGSLVKWSGYGSLGVAAAFLAAVANFCFSRLSSAARTASSPEVIA